MTTKTIKVKGMSCNHCKGSVNNMISGIPGVEKTEVNLEDGTATIEFDPSLINVDRILEKINLSQYQASAM